MRRKLVDDPQAARIRPRRYVNELNRSVRRAGPSRLTERRLFAGEYSIADMASWPWTRNYAGYGQDLG